MAELRAERAVAPFVRSNVSLELKISWGDRVLHVAHVTPPRDVWIGDDATGPVDYALPIPRTCVASVRDGAIVCSAIGIESDEGPYREVDDCVLRVRVAEVETGERPPRAHGGWGADAAMWTCAAWLHLAVLAGLAASPRDTIDEDVIGLDSSLRYRVALDTLRELEERVSARRAVQHSASGNDLGAAHAGTAGSLGAKRAKNANAHFTVAGPRATPELRLSRVRAQIESGHYGALAAISQLAASTGAGPFGGVDDESLGTDPRSVLGNLYGRAWGEAAGTDGFGGLALAQGGEGAFSGIGISDLGTVGGCGCGSGRWGDVTIGRGTSGAKSFRHKTQVVRIPDAGDTISGKLLPEIVRRVVHASFPRFRMCYERGLKRDPSLAGTVAVRFVIDSTGAVETASLTGGTLAAADVRQCVLDVYRTLSFPEPESGKVLATYPIDFQPE